MNPAWRRGEEIEGVFEIARGVVHNRASIAGDGPITIRTDPLQWSFAAAFRFQAQTLNPAGEAVLFLIHAAVQSGRIGAVFVADDLATVLSNSAERWLPDSSTELEVLVRPVPVSGWLFLRNHAATGSSQCEVRCIQAFRAEGTTTAGAGDPADPGSGSTDFPGGDVLGSLRRKWVELPATLSERRNTAELAGLSDEQLWRFWNRITREMTTGEGYSIRGWYHELYKDILRGKRVLDVGCGLGTDGLTLARAGAQITFLDIARSNLEVVERLCRIAHLPGVRFHYLEDLSSLETLPRDFDAIWCMGSMIPAPFSFARLEARALLEHLPAGGRWIELAYPRERWEREGRLPFREWGNLTDGDGTPWMEWYDLARLRARLSPAEFDVVLHFDFHQGDFNWFDLIRRT